MPEHQLDLLAASAATERPPDRTDLVARLPVARRGGDRIPCSFHGHGLDARQWLEADWWFNTAAAWRAELGSLDASRRYNRAVLAALLRVQRAQMPVGAPLPDHCLAAARAGIERIVWELTGKRIVLRRRCKPLRVPVPLFLRGVFQAVMHNLV